MPPRIAYAEVAPKAFRALVGLETYTKHATIEPSLRELVKIRASQLNGCAYCIDMHWKDARAAGETEQRLYGLSAWRETAFYSDRERAALAWTEAVTMVNEGHVPDEVFAHAREQFSEEELVDLTVVIATINAWNRMAISFRSEPGSYQPAPKH